MTRPLVDTSGFVFWERDMTKKYGAFKNNSTGEEMSVDMDTFELALASMAETDGAAIPQYGQVKLPNSTIV
jgi:hypothetical protein